MKRLGYILIIVGFFTVALSIKSCVSPRDSKNMMDTTGIHGMQLDTDGDYQWFDHLRHVQLGVLGGIVIIFIGQYLKGIKKIDKL